MTMWKHERAELYALAKTGLSFAGEYAAEIATILEDVENSYRREMRRRMVQIADKVWERRDKTALCVALAANHAVNGEEEYDKTRRTISRLLCEAEARHAGYDCAGFTSPTIYVR